MPRSVKTVTLIPKLQIKLRHHCHTMGHFSSAVCSK